MTRPQQPRIDLNHGYMRFIRRNQLDRDEYDRVHEQRKSEIRERIGESQRSIEPVKKPNVYIPPHLRRQLKEIEEKRVEASEKAPRSICRSDSDSQDDEKEICPILKKQREADDHVRKQVRRRIERTYPTVDDICCTLANYSLQETSERYSIRDGEEDLFTLELTLKNGDKKTIGVPRNTKAARLAKSLSREYNFDDSQCRNLRIFIEEQLEHRLAREARRSRSPDPSVPTSPMSSTSSSSSSITFSM